MDLNNLSLFGENIIAFLINPSFDGFMGIIRIVFIVLSFLLIIAAAFFASRSNYIKFAYLEDTSEFVTFRPHGVRKLANTWKKIKSRMETGLESEYKLAVIEADGILDTVLKKMGYAGESLGERLEKLTSATLSNIEEIKEAHKTRTNILHDPNYSLSLDETRNIIAVYEKALENLQAF